MAYYNEDRGYESRRRDTNESRTGYGNRYEETSYRSGYGNFGSYGDRDDAGDTRSDRGSYGTQGSHGTQGSYGTRGSYDDRGSRGSYNDHRSRGDRGSYGGRDHDRGFFERAGDEVRSWFGDDEAERRRRIDEQDDERRARYDYDRGSDYRHNYGSGGWDSDRVRRDLDRDDAWRRGGQEQGRRFNDRGDIGYTSGGLGAGYGRDEHYPSTTGYGGPGYGGLDRDHGSDRGDRHGLRGAFGNADLSHDRGRDRGPVERAGDEVRTWFGDDEAERRRRMDAAEGNRNYRNDRHDDRRDPRGRW